jgi:hypothetical protein
MGPTGFVPEAKYQLVSAAMKKPSVFNAATAGSLPTAGLAGKFEPAERAAVKVFLPHTFPVRGQVSRHAVR